MKLSRRNVLALGTSFAVGAVLSQRAARADFAPRPGGWRKFELVTKVNIPNPVDAPQAWIPLPSFDQPAWMRPDESTWKTNAGFAEKIRDPRYGAQMLHLKWARGEPDPAVEITSVVVTQDRAVDLTTPGEAAAPLSSAEREINLAATKLIPIAGIVKETSDKITAGANSDLEKANAIYQWIVANTYRDAKARGCGLGDIATMLMSGNLGGKCADLNALFVGLARAAGLPARDLYGLRVAPSNFGYKSLGAKSEVVTKAQHCRAEVFLNDFGWVPVDPADVRKVILEEPPGNLPIDDTKVVDARKALFGSWEGNWLAYNSAHDVALPGASGRIKEVGFLMYPQAEVGGELVDCLDADAFKYTITAREISA